MQTLSLGNTTVKMLLNGSVAKHYGDAISQSPPTYKPEVGAGTLPSRGRRSRQGKPELPGGAGERQ